MILMPNKDLSSSKIINYTVLGRRRIVRTVTASYDVPTETVMTACMEAVEATANILPDPAPAVYLTNYGASSIEYTITAGAPWRTTGPPITPSMRSCGTPSPNTMLK